jgi:hypothetical protein
VVLGSAKPITAPSRSMSAISAPTSLASRPAWRLGWRPDADPRGGPVGLRLEPRVELLHEIRAERPVQLERRDEHHHDDERHVADEELRPEREPHAVRSSDHGSRSLYPKPCTVSIASP